MLKDTALQRVVEPRPELQVAARNMVIFVAFVRKESARDVVSKRSNWSYKCVVSLGHANVQVYY